jgi:hypothetical protein
MLLVMSTLTSGISQLTLVIITLCLTANCFVVWYRILPSFSNCGHFPVTLHFPYFSIFFLFVSSFLRVWIQCLIYRKLKWSNCFTIVILLLYQYFLKCRILSVNCAKLKLAHWWSVLNFRFNVRRSKTLTTELKTVVCG